MWPPRRAGLLLLCLCLPGIAGGQSAEQTERELAEIRGRIEALQREQTERSRQRDRAAAQLQEAEQGLAAARRSLARTGQDLQQAAGEQAAVERRLEAAAREASASRELLAAQLRETYYSGRQEGLRLLLNQEDPARLGRMLVYYDFLNRHRSERLAALRERLAVLQQLGEEARLARLRLAQLQQRQQAELDEIETAQAQRRAALARIEAELTEAGGELRALRSQEQELSDLVERLRRELASFPADPQTPFASRQGQLPWPLEAQLLHAFGEVRGDGGELRWNGLLLGAERGREVRAVHFGRVAYADWLPGMGLLLVLDHGHGYMSLYGHNEVLLREPGEWVAPGESVAQVGDTGGQNRTGLYFEIRHEGRPVNPAQWLVAPQ